MRWERVTAKNKNGEDVEVKKSPGRKGGGLGPGKRWGHTCNSVRNGRALYVFGGYGKDNCQTNDVHILDPIKQTWTKPIMKGKPPTPRDSHSCTTVGSCLFVFGGTDGHKPLGDLLILDTATNTWIEPEVYGEVPAPREGHSAALLGRCLFIYGGCGKTQDGEDIYYNDLYILDTFKITWTRAVTSGNQPSPRDSHSCSAWNNKIIVIGGEDELDSYLSDVYVLDADTLIWDQLKTTGQNLTPRAGHCTVPWGKHLFVFGGFTDDRNLYDDLHVLNLETGVWTKAVIDVPGPSARFSVVGDCLDYKRGILVFIGGCNKNLEALDELYYLHTEMMMENVPEDQKPEKLSLRKELKRKRQEHHVSFNNSEREKDIAMLEGMEKFSCYDFKPVEEKLFEAKITNVFHYGYTIESFIDGKHLRGLLFSHKPGFYHAVDNYLARKHMTSKPNATNSKRCRKSKLKVAHTAKQSLRVDGLPQLPMHTEYADQVVTGKQHAPPSNQNTAFPEQYQHHVQLSPLSPLSSTPTVHYNQKTNTVSGFANALQELPTSFQRSAPLSSTSEIYCYQNTGSGSGLTSALHTTPNSFQSAPLPSTLAFHCDQKTSTDSDFAIASHKMPTSFQQSAPLPSTLAVHCDQKISTDSDFAIASHKMPTSFQESAPLSSTPGVNYDQKTDTSSGFVNVSQAVPTSFQQSALFPSTPAVHCDQRTDTGSGFGNALHKMLTSFQQSAPILSTPPLHCKEMTESGSGYANSLHMMLPAFQQSAPLLSTSSIHCDPKNDTRLGLPDASQQIPTSLQLSAPLDSTPPVQCDPKPETGPEFASCIQSTHVECDSQSNFELGFTTNLHSRKENVPTPQHTLEGTCAITSLSLSRVGQSQPSPANQGSQPTQENADQVEQIQEVSGAE